MVYIDRVFLIYIGDHLASEPWHGGQKSEISARDWSRIMASTDPERERRNYHGRASLVCCVMVEMMIDRVIF